MLYCAAATRMLRNVRLPMKFARTPHGRTCDSLANLHDHLATALRANVRQSCEYGTAALSVVKFHSHEVCNYICDLLHGLTPAENLTAKTIVQALDRPSDSKLVYILASSRYESECVFEDYFTYFSTITQI